MKPTRIGKPFTSTDHGKRVTRCYVWFPDGTRELMNEARLTWTLAHGRPEKGYVVYERDGSLVCVHRREMAREKNSVGGPTKSEGSRKGWNTRRYARRARAAQVYMDHKPYPLT